MQHDLQQLRAEGHRLRADLSLREDEIAKLKTLLDMAELEAKALRKELAQVKNLDDTPEWTVPPPPVKAKRGRPPLLRQE